LPQHVKNTRAFNSPTRCNIIKDDEDTTDDTSDNPINKGVDGGNNEIDESKNQTLETTGVTRAEIEGNTYSDNGDTCNENVVEGNEYHTEGKINHTEGNINDIEGNLNNNEGNTPDDEGNLSGYNGNTHHADDDEISIENGSTEDPQVTINNINIIEEMNAAHINNDAEAGEEAIADNHGWRTVANNNRYNLRPRPTKRNDRYTLLQEGQLSAKVAIPKPHAHVMLTQINVQEGIKRFGANGNEELLKE